MITGKFRHALSRDLLDKAVRVKVLGVGGTGSHLAVDLAVLSQTMLDLGHPFGLDVTLIDPDVVSATNIGRARFYPSDEGQYKAAVLAHRINISMGMNFTAECRGLDSSDISSSDILVGCVDTRKARREIVRHINDLYDFESGYYLDIGNGATDGQVILGQYGRNLKSRLPHVIDLYGEMMDEANDSEDSGPSCSRKEALAKQSAFVNKTASIHAINLLSALFRDGGLHHHGVFFDCKTGRSTPLMCDTVAWERMGYSHHHKAHKELKQAA